MDRCTEIIQRIQESLQPEQLAVVDESHLHQGHKGVIPGGHYTHLLVRMTVSSLKGLSILERHRRVQDILAPFFQQGLHAARLEIKV